MEPKKPNLRERQKNATLSLIKETARSLFSTKEYDSISVEEIAQISNVSRGTIYKHFKSKLDIILSIVNDDLELHQGAYRDLSKMTDVDAQSVGEWLGKFVERTRSSNRFLITFFVGYNENFSMIINHRNKVIDILGKRFLGFDLNRGGDALIEQYRAQCFMMLFIIESGAITYSVETEAVDPLIGLDMIAKSFLEFLLSGEIHVRNQLVG